MTTTGSGLGLWIAHAFVSACAGRLEAASPGPDRGTTVTMLLPAPSIAKLSASGETYE
jgi:K+-sensing histidine kinase KdpD